MRWLLVVSSLACVGCSQDSGTIQLVTGLETDTFTQAPVPTSLTVYAVETAADGGVMSPTALAKAVWPATTIDLGKQNESTNARLTVSGIAANGAPVVYGASMPLNFGALAGTTIPIFVQRTGEFARLPDPPSDMRTAPTLVVFDSEYLLVAGGQDADADTTQIYDFLQLAPAGSPPVLPQVPESIAFDGTVSWLIDGDAGTYFDFSDSDSGTISLPTLPNGSAGQFSDIAGGATIVDDTGAQYIVGATRTSGAPSARVLKIDPNAATATYPNGNATWLTLSSARLGAAAAWVSGTGLVVAGGSATASGVEVMGGSTSTTSTIGVPLPYPPDASSGAGAIALDGQHVLLAGGIVSGADAGVRVVDLGCNAPPDAGASPDAGLTLAVPCTPTVWSSLPVPLAFTQVFTTNGQSVLIVGSEASGPTHAFKALGPMTDDIADASPGVTEIPTKVPHTNARAVVSPTGTVVLFGGAMQIESFTP
jgi:hypothetical protein